MTMNYLLISTFLLFCLAFNDDVVGNYSNQIGSTLVLKKDYTFAEDYNIHMYADWCNGRWTRLKDTIYLTTVPIYDTLKLPYRPDSLVLSQTREPKVITDENEFVISRLSCSQYIRPNRKFLFRKNRLYVIDSLGKLEIKKTFRMPNGKKYTTWFVRK
jgi:hypothetical protein